MTVVADAVILHKINMLETELEKINMNNKLVEIRILRHNNINHIITLKERQIEQMEEFLYF